MSPVVKRKRGRINIPSGYLLFALAMICVGLSALTFMTDVLDEPINNTVGVVVVPFQKGISSVGSWISDRSDELVQIKDVLTENQKLKQQIDELTIENTILQQDKYELNNLRKLYKLDQEYAQYEKVGARVIASNGINWFHTFVVDKGSNDGIKVDMNVMAGSGLVGRVIEIGPNWSKVISIIDDNSNVSGMTLATSDNLIVAGDLELMQNAGVVRFERLADNSSKVVEGDKIVTSNISPKYLPGILIGYISSINTDSNNLTKSGQITPAVDFEHLEEVLIILELKNEE